MPSRRRAPAIGRSGVGRSAKQAVGHERERNGDRGAEGGHRLEARARQDAAVGEPLVSEGGEGQGFVGRGRARGQRDERGVDAHGRRDRGEQGDGAAPRSLLGREIVSRARGSLESRVDDVEVGEERGRGGRSLLGIDGHRAREDGAERRGLGRQRDGFDADGMPPGEHVLEQRAEGVDVHTRVSGGARSRLGREISGCAEHDRGARERALSGRRLEQARDAEVRELRASVVADEDVLGLDGTTHIE